MKFEWLSSYSFLLHHLFQKRKLSFSLQTQKKTVTLPCRTLRTSRRGHLSSEVGGEQWVRTIRLYIERGRKDVPPLMGLRVLPLPKEVSSVTTRRLPWVSLLGGLCSLDAHLSHLSPALPQHYRDWVADENTKLLLIRHTPHWVLLNSRLGFLRYLHIHTHTVKGRVFS